MNCLIVFSVAVISVQLSEVLASQRLIRPVRRPIFHPHQASEYQQPRLAKQCSDGLVRKIDGSCVQPIVSRKIFVYNAPEHQLTYGPPPKLPNPSINYNYVFIRTPNAQNGPSPIVIPPTQQKTVVYVLNENSNQQQQVIEVPSDVIAPEVFYVNYDQGENPILPGGIDLETALKGSAIQPSVIEDGLGGVQEEPDLDLSYSHNVPQTDDSTYHNDLGASLFVNENLDLY